MCTSGQPQHPSIAMQRDHRTRLDVDDAGAWAEATRESKTVR